jgi:hypothetical protein
MTSPIFRTYRRLMEGSHTVNQLNRLHILLENRMTPREVHSIARKGRRERQGTPRFFSAVRFPHYRVHKLLLKLPHNPTLWPLLRKIYAENWITGLGHWLRVLHHSREPSDWKRTVLHGSHFHFSRPGHVRRNLLICFPGMHHRMLASTPIFLEAYSAVDSDVLLLGTGWGLGTGGGIHGLGDNFDQATKSLSDWAISMGYQDLWTYGTSRGALPALRYGFALGASRIVSVGLKTSASRDESLADLADSAGRADGVQVRLIFGADAIGDGHACFEARRHIPYASISAIPEAQHAPIWPLLLRGQLPSFFAAVFSGQRLDASRGEEFMVTAPPSMEHYDDFAAGAIPIG